MDGMASFHDPFDRLRIETPHPSELANLIGFSKRPGLDDSGWRSLIRAQTVVCAQTPSGQLAGVYVANHYALSEPDDRLQALRAAMNVLCNRFRLDPSSVAFGAEAFIPSAGSPRMAAANLRAHLLRGLLRSVGLRYRYLFSFCPNQEGAELYARQNEGWRCFQEEDDGCYLMLDAAHTLRALASRLILGSADKDDITGQRRGLTSEPRVASFLDMHR